VELGAARTGAVSEIPQAIAVVCGGETLPIVVKSAAGPTFREVAEEWTSGRLHKRYPDPMISRSIGTVPSWSFALSARAGCEFPSGS
jgi:hypothetical protein